jgi:hypothetical protein
MSGRIVPTIDDVARIVAIENRVIRNLEITQCYAELSSAMRERTASVPNWCTFATWASRQAGATIRGEDLLERFARKLGNKTRVLEPVRSINRKLLQKGLFQPSSRLGSAVAAIHTPFDAFERTSETVALGNLKVFEEIAHVFAKFLAAVPPHAAVESDAFVLFALDLVPGAPPDGQDLLSEAFTHYQRQQMETDPALRSALILLGNLKIGLHEQTRLQPQIFAAIEAPLTTAEDLGARALDALFPGARNWPTMLRRPSASVAGIFARGMHNSASEITRAVVTECLMTLVLPNRVLDLAENLDARVPAVFSHELPSELAEFVREYDPCETGTSNCGADDWSDLRQRMHYILHLFRAFADDDRLFEPPFPPDSVRSIRAGMVPDGAL